jgi:hypothetical protein
MFTSMFGTMTEVIQMSTRDSLERKKYMSMCRREYEMIIRMMSRFSGTVIGYMVRKGPLDEKLKIFMF